MNKRICIVNVLFIIVLTLTSCSPAATQLPATIEPIEMAEAVTEAVAVQEEAILPTEAQVEVEEASLESSPSNTPAPRSPITINWAPRNDLKKNLDGNAIIAGKEMVIIAKVDPSWKGKELIFHVYEEDFGFWNADDKITELKGVVDDQGNIKTVDKWGPIFQPGDPGKQSEYYVRYISYPDPADQKNSEKRKLIDVDQKPKFYVPEKTIAVGLDYSLTKKNYNLSINLGVDNITLGIGKLFKNLLGTKGIIDLKKQTGRFEITLDNVSYDPEIRLSVIYPDRLHQSEKEWHFSFEFLEAQSEATCQKEDMCTLWLPGEDAEATIATLVVSPPETGGFIPFAIKAEIITPESDERTFVYTPVYAVISEGSSLNLEEEVKCDIQLEP